MVYLHKNMLRSFHKYPEHSRTTYLCIFDAFYENICLLITKFRIKTTAYFCLLTTAQLDRSTDISATNPSVCFNGLLYAEGTYVSLFNLVEKGNG